jgi:putative protease
VTSVPLLLAPAGTPEAVGAAVDAGADAVYVGLKGWSRGGERRELGWKELAAANRQVTSAGGKLQVAINTIPKPRELSELFERVPALLDLGIREVIVNDVGILTALRGRFPELRLTASIGCGAQTVADVSFLRGLGADAVVLPGTVSPSEAREIRAVSGITIEIMVHMVEEFILLGKCWMPSYVHLKPSSLPAVFPSEEVAGDDGADGAGRGLRQTGSMKRGGVGACYRICQQPWELYSFERRMDSRLFPSRQISRLAEVNAYAEAGVDVLKLQGRSLPVELLAPLVRRYRHAIDAGAAPAAGAVAFAELPAAWAVVGR